MSERLLPEGYEALEPFVAAWALNGSAARAQRRSDSTPEERHAFFDAAKSLVGPACDLLDQKPLTALDSKENRLMNLLLSFTHVAMAVEIQGDAEPRHAKLRSYMHITNSAADRPPRRAEGSIE